MSIGRILYVLNRKECSNGATDRCQNLSYVGSVWYLKVGKELYAINMKWNQLRQRNLT